MYFVGSVWRAVISGITICIFVFAYIETPMWHCRYGCGCMCGCKAISKCMCVCVCATTDMFAVSLYFICICIGVVGPVYFSIFIRGIKQRFYSFIFHVVLINLYSYREGGCREDKRLPDKISNPRCMKVRPCGWFHKWKIVAE